SRDRPSRISRSLSSGSARARPGGSMRAAKIFFKKYRRFTGENARQLQGNALRGREKIRRRKNNGKQEKKQAKKQCAEQSDNQGACMRPVGRDPRASVPSPKYASICRGS